MENFENPDKIISLMNEFICTATVMHRNLHLMHWNMKGEGFVTIHPYFNELYDDLMDDIDLIAEELIKNGSCPKASLKDCLEKSRVPAYESSKIKVKDAVESAYKLYETILVLVNEIYAEAERLHLYAIADLATQLTHKYTKAKWFLKSESDD